MTRPRILLVSSGLSTFVEQDRSLLGEVGNVDLLLYRGKRDLASLFGRVARSDVVVCWFVLGYATTAVAISLVFGKPTLLIAGGWDVATVPEIGYGAMRWPSRIRKTRYALRHATRILAVSGYTRGEVARWTNRHVAVVYNGVDTDFFRPDGNRLKQVVTVAGVRNETRFRTKGLDVLFATASRLPAVPFLVVGGNSPEWDRKMKAIAPSNVRILGSIDRTRLREAYRSSWVYAQLSAHESFGVALAEAMACGCVAVVSDRGALPEVVGDAGYVVPYGDPDATADALKHALDDSEACHTARGRVVAMFSRERRRRALLHEVSRLI